ncbi:UPF0193 protein EVG1 homolog [Vanessa atalanta]|uniref:UPF0193 protein EVG1 homolog n=1 Tax=Vanessa atalanta TaxID=42275 RepID=UPI001FCD2B48|nr:UPF0193 protein EVG1 homolog [Vanessa atalanta]
MEKPDSHGYVNITWPSKSIPHGGIFHTRTVSPSAAQQEFLKVLLEESKLSISQRQKGAFALRQEDEFPKKKIKVEVPLVRPRTSRRRSLSAIRESEASNVEIYCPLKRGEDREKLKERLANTMTYGDMEQKPPALPQLLRQKPNLPTKKEQWNDLVTQIRERAEWLADMEDLGHAGPHRELIKDQIAERMRALDAIGIDSCCSSARSTKSGFSVVPSVHSVHSNGSKYSKTSNNIQKNLKPKSNITKLTKKLEENVAAYEQLSPLQYSPRRRV